MDAAEWTSALSELGVSLRSRFETLFTYNGYTSIITVLFFGVVIYLALAHAYLPRRAARGASDVSPLELAEIQAKVSAWKAAPLERPEFLDRYGDDSDFDATETALIPGVDITSELIGRLDNLDDRIVLTTAAGPEVGVQGIEGQVVNVASSNFLGLVGDDYIVKACKRTMRKYGCGACGPRGFYGTVDVHLECEDSIAKLMDAENAILYSFGSAAGSSVIPAFCKREDVVICDKGINFALQTGVNLSRAQVKWFDHNDMDDLERILKEVTAEDAKNPGRALTQRRFIVIEGLYANYGDSAPLDRIFELKKQYLVRIILDESHSLGGLGATGLGALERFSIARADIDITCADLGNAFATVGGVCVGSKEVVSHQRLSGAGYCFSASQPPFLAKAATEAARAISKRGNTLAQACVRNTASFRKALQTSTLEAAGWQVSDDALSPLIHFRPLHATISHERAICLQKECLRKGVLVAAPTYVDSEKFAPPFGLRVCISAAHSRDNIETAASVIRAVLTANPVNAN